MSINPDVIRAFEEAPIWYLATCWNGEPNVVPVGCKWIDADRLLMADFYFNKTRTNLESCPRVAVSVGLLNPKRGFQVKATARGHRDGPVFERVCQLLRSAGVDTIPWGALEVSFEEVYVLDPGTNAGKRIT
ncbi:MAG: pyridoxamine 5'-phosphate oxidase family protein [Phycisphaeraceae bacterium]|nr:pyridoxamine 5'-phosphate oxidase family protein [Phycisphaeraceae bacterium]